MPNPTIPGLYYVSGGTPENENDNREWTVANWVLGPPAHWRSVGTDFRSDDNKIEDGRVHRWKGPLLLLEETPSVLHPWVMQLCRREQGVLLTAIRGCDLAPKYPLDSPERRLTAAIRYAVLIAYDEREVDRVPGSFMSRKIPNIKLNQLEHYPLHWVTHVMHAAEVLGYRHPEENIREQWLTVYWEFVRGLHLNPEALEDMAARLSEDRIARGNIVT